jgi:hypothetical protein
LTRRCRHHGHGLVSVVDHERCGETYGRSKSLHGVCDSSGGRRAFSCWP